MKRVTEARARLSLLILFSILAAVFPVALAAYYSSDYEFFRVPIASWVVFCLGGIILLLDAVVIRVQRRFRKSGQALSRAEEALDAMSRQLAALQATPLQASLPVVRGYEHLACAEFVVLLQTLFGATPDVGCVQVVKSFAGGYGGNSTLLVRLQSTQGELLPRSFVVKLGARQDMVGEHKRFGACVSGHLDCAPQLMHYAECGDLAGIAYKFAGTGNQVEIQSFHQYYAGYAAVEVADLIGDVYACLHEAWYRAGENESVDPYREYALLHRKKQPIIEGVGRIVDEDDAYHVNFAAASGELRTRRKPRFCPDPDLEWADPIAFVRTWPVHASPLLIHRSTVHGDLNARNLLVEIAANGHKRVWFIDFSHTGNGLSPGHVAELQAQGHPVDALRGHTLRDFGRLEADVKFLLTRLCSDEDLRLATAFERALLSQSPDLAGLPEVPPFPAAEADERFQKAWRVVREIRCHAARYLAWQEDTRAYWWSLLHATLPIVYYHPAQFAGAECERQQKRYALLAAGMLCARL